MSKEHTHITVILDRSGSMESIKDDTIGGFNAFLKEQKKVEGQATLTLVQFDNQDPYEVIHHFAAMDKVSNLTAKKYVPRGATPLLDAMGRGINDVAKNIADLKKKDRPTKVVMVIVTDGMENASQEFTKAQVEKMVAEKQKKEDWQFVFLSADMGAIDEAVALGVMDQKALRFNKTGKGSRGAWASVSERTMNFRSNMEVDVSFKDEDQQEEE